MLSLSTIAVHPASQSLPRLRRLWANPGMMCPVWACRLGMVEMASCAVAEDMHILPEAVRMVVGGAAWLMCRSGAAVVK